MRERRRELAEEFQSHVGGLRVPIISYCRHQLWDKGELEDTVQAVLTVAFERFEQFQHGTDFRAWILRICTNVVFNANRRFARDRQRFVRGDDDVVDLVDELKREYPYEELLRNPDKVLSHVDDELRGALLELGPKERTVFLLKTIGELSCREIAESLGMPLGSVMAYLSRARGKLRVRLCEYGRRYGLLTDYIREGEADGLQDG